jgi:hypothetical protein
MIHESAPVTNAFVSVPADMGQLNCAAFLAGIIAGVLDSARFVSHNVLSLIEVTWEESFYILLCHLYLLLSPLLPSSVSPIPPSLSPSLTLPPYLPNLVSTRVSQPTQSLRRISHQEDRLTTKPFSLLNSQQKSWQGKEEWVKNRDLEKEKGFVALVLICILCLFISMISLFFFCNEERYRFLNTSDYILHANNSARHCGDRQY